MSWFSLHQSESEDKTGIALGGGAVLGAAHIGFLKAMEEKKLKADLICGTSIGALIGAFYAFGKRSEEIEKISHQLNWLDITTISLTKYGLLSNEKMGALIEKHLGKVNMEDADIPFAVVTTDVSTGKKVVIKEGPVSKAVTASASIPGVFKPVEINGQLLVDGGIVENVPVPSVREMGATYAIGVDLNSRRSYERPDNILGVLLNSFHFVMKQAVENHANAASLLIEPDLTGFNWTDTKQIKDLIRKGYEESVKQLNSGDGPGQ